MIRDKVAIITGAASGIGLAVAAAFAREGAKVVMGDINEEALTTEAGNIGVEAFLAGDLSKGGNCIALVNYALEKYGRTDILVNVAGIQTIAHIDEFPDDKWEFMIDLMLNAPFYLIKYCWPSMKASGWGRIINISSIHGLVASEYKAAYISAKHGLIGLTKATGIEGGPLGITVNAICPAYVRTPLVDNQIAKQAELHNMSENEVVEKILLTKSFIKKLIEPSTVADMCLFLCSKTADGMTGSNIVMDGGWVQS